MPKASDYPLKRSQVQSSRFRVGQLTIGFWVNLPEADKRHKKFFHCFSLRALRLCARLFGFSVRDSGEMSPKLFQFFLCLGNVFCNLKERHDFGYTEHLPDVVGQFTQDTALPMS